MAIGETCLNKLIAGLSPELTESLFVFVSVSGPVSSALQHAALECTKQRHEQDSSVSLAQWQETHLEKVGSILTKLGFKE